MNIGLDFDDVIAYSHALKPLVARELFEVEIPEALFRREYVVGQGILNDEQYKQVGKKVFSGEYPMEAVPGSLLFIGQMMKDGHALRIVTNRSKEWETLWVAEYWLKENSLDLPVTGIPYGSSKASACGGLDLFVDDDPPKLAELIGVVPHLIHFRWPHNSHEKVAEGIVVCDRWGQIYHHITQINHSLQTSGG